MAEASKARKLLLASEAPNSAALPFFFLSPLHSQCSTLARRAIASSLSARPHSGAVPVCSCREARGHPAHTAQGVSYPPPLPSLAQRPFLPSFPPKPLALSPPACLLAPRQYREPREKVRCSRACVLPEYVGTADYSTCVAGSALFCISSLWTPMSTASQAHKWNCPSLLPPFTHPILITSASSSPRSHCATLHHTYVEYRTITLATSVQCSHSPSTSPSPLHASIKHLPPALEQLSRLSYSTE